MATKQTEAEALVESTFTQFEKNLQLVRDFGVQALKNSLNQKLQGQGQSFKVGDAELISLFGSSAPDSEIDKVLKETGLLDTVQKFLALENTPRYETNPDVVNKRELGTEPSRGSANFLSNPLLAKLMGDAADPKVRQNIFNDAADIIAQNRNPREWTPLQNAKVQQAYELELKLRMANRLHLTPTYTPPKPRPQ